MKFEEDFECILVEHDKIKHDVWVGGHGPPVILMHELDGFGNACISLAERLAEKFRVYAPRFFGRVRQREGNLGAVKGIAYICVHREFVVFAKGKTSPVVDWVRKLAQHASQQNPDHKKVGVVGMCMTGGIVLATVADPVVAAGVAAQPSLPLTHRFSSAAKRRDLGMSHDDINDAAASETPILTLRFGRDRICPIERIDAVKDLIPKVEGPPEFLQDSDEHPTLTALYRKDICQKDRDKSDQAIDTTIDFLEKHI